MARFSVEDLTKIRKAVKVAYPENAGLIEKIETELDVQKIHRAGRAKRKKAAPLPRE